MLAEVLKTQICLEQDDNGNIAVFIELLKRGSINIQAQNKAI